MHRPARLPVLIALALAARDARADSASEAADLFERGRELTRAGNDREACPLFEKSLALAPALGTELNLARCWAATGRLVAAKQLFEGLVAKTQNANQPQREQLARDGLADVTARMPHLAIERGPITAAIRLDDRVVDVAQPLAVDPGHHAITADGARSVTVDLGEGETRTIVLQAAMPELPAPPGTHRALLWGLGAGGGAALLAGTVTGIIAIREHDAGRDRCTPDPSGALVCDARGKQLLDRSRVTSHVTTGLFVAAAAVAAAAIVIGVRDDRGPTVWASSSSAGLGWQCAW